MKLGTRYVVDHMSLRTQTREVERTLPKVVEQSADYHQSGDVASQHNGTRIKLERLPALLNDPEFVKTIESTESYKRSGYTWFWTDTVGTNLSGYYKINPKGKTLDEMFTFISKEWDRDVEKVPFNERACFWKGSQPLSVRVRRSGILDRRLVVCGFDRLDDVAPVVVVEQAQAASSQAGSVAAAPESQAETSAIPSTVITNAHNSLALLETGSPVRESHAKELSDLRLLVDAARRLRGNPLDLADAAIAQKRQ